MKILKMLLALSLFLNLSYFSYSQTIIKLSDLINYKKKLEDLISYKDSVWLLIDKKKHMAYFMEKDRILKAYPVAMSELFINDKERAGDLGVPEGIYFLTAKATGKTFYKFSPINYPDTSDARKALEKRIINKKEYEKIKRANNEKWSFIPHTRAGSAIGLHGSIPGNDSALGVGYLIDPNKDSIKNININESFFYVSDWTLGCIAFNNADWNEIIKYMKSWKTPIYIMKTISKDSLTAYLKAIKKIYK